MLTKEKKCIYTPKSKFHIDFGWQFAFTDALGCPRKRDLLEQILYFSQKDDSTFTNSLGEQYQGMLINYESLAQKLGISRRTLQTLLNQLANDGFLVKYKLNNNRVLAQATEKAFTLLASVHEESLAAKTHAKDYDRLSDNFEIVRNFAPELQARQFLHDSDDKLGKFCQAPLYRNKVNKEKTINNNLYEVLETATQFENTDCLTVIFYFDEFGLREIAAEEDLFDYFTVAQSQILNTIVHCAGSIIDIHVFNETLLKDDLRRAAKNFRQLVDWAYSAATDHARSTAMQTEIQAAGVNEVIKTDNLCDAETKGIAKISTTQMDGGSVVDNTADFHHDKIIKVNQPCYKDRHLDINMPVVEQEVLRKDWASLADQQFYEGLLPDSQKIALVAIIDYVKRKGVVIGSDSEIYRWLYHTVSNHQHYYSRATNFKHLANILIKQLMNRHFERPSGFNAWEDNINQQAGYQQMRQKE